jgi:hypothetical protein
MDANHEKFENSIVQLLSDSSLGSVCYSMEGLRSINHINYYKLGFNLTINKLNSNTKRPFAITRK